MSTHNFNEPDHCNPYWQSQAHDHTHIGQASHLHDNAAPGIGHTSRRDFLHVLIGGALAGASIVELAYHRAAWARATARSSNPRLFAIQRVDDDVYFARACPQAMVNCNAAIFVRSTDVVVVDAHSKPSAAANLIGQIKKEITTKPVRYVINTHFHWDHVQGNHAYRLAGEKVDFIASATTKRLMADLAIDRMKASMAAVPQTIDTLVARAANSSSAGEKAFCADQIRQLQAYLTELKENTLELPTITFEKSYLLHDTKLDLHIEFHGHAHTAGDVVVFCPQRRVIATGDVIHGFLPFISDGFPRSWPGTIDSIGDADFDHILPGHAALQSGRTIMTNLRDYIEELTGRVEEGKRAGQTMAELQERITVASLKSLQANAYESYLMRSISQSDAHFGKIPPLQTGVSVNVGEIYTNLDRL